MDHDERVLRNLFQVIPNPLKLLLREASVIGGATENIVVAARQHPVQTLEAMWSKLTLPSLPFFPDDLEQYLSIYGNPHRYRPRYDYLDVLSWTSVYRTDPLRQLLNDLVDFAKLNGTDAMHLIVSATNVRTGEIAYFDNRKTTITAAHIVASGSLPPGFPMTEIDGDSYWEGGLFDNTPLRPVSRALDANPEVPKRVFVVELFPNANHLPRTLAEVFDRVLEIIFENKFVNDRQNLHQVNDYIETVQALEDLFDAIDIRPETQDLRDKVQALRALRGYQRLKAYEPLIELIVIENREPEVAFGPSDFSAPTIQRRIEAGYRDASLALQQHGLALESNAGHATA